MLAPALRACKQICFKRQTGVPADCPAFFDGALAWGARGPGFKSRRPDQKFQTLTAETFVAPRVLESIWSPKWTPVPNAEQPSCPQKERFGRWLLKILTIFKTGLPLRRMTSSESAGATFAALAHTIDWGRPVR